jgi:quinol monooxygenase YgiN
MTAIVICATIDLRPGGRDRMLRDAQSDIAAALAEPGCVAYTWSSDPIEADRVHVFEEWKSEAALADHFSSEAYLEMGARLRTVGVVAMVATKYQVTAVAPLFVSGIATPRFEARTG